MGYDQWLELFRPYGTRADIRKLLSGEMQMLLQSCNGRAVLSPEVQQLGTGSDREVLESFDTLQRICAAMTSEKRRSIEGALNVDLCELFATALERMNRLPLEPRPAIKGP